MSKTYYNATQVQTHYIHSYKVIILYGMGKIKKRVTDTDRIFKPRAPQCYSSLYSLVSQGPATCDICGTVIAYASRMHRHKETLKCRQAAYNKAQVTYWCASVEDPRNLVSLIRADSTKWRHPHHTLRFLNNNAHLKNNFTFDLSTILCTISVICLMYNLTL